MNNTKFINLYKNKYIYYGLNQVKIVEDYHFLEYSFKLHNSIIVVNYRVLIFGWTFAMRVLNISCQAVIENRK